MATSRLTRRQVLQSLIAAPAVAPSAYGDTEQTPAPIRTRALTVGVVSRHLQWTSLEDAVTLARDAGFDEIEWNVRTGGHVRPDRVEQDLRRAIELSRQAGLATPMITTSIQDANSPHAEAILATASALGVTYYRGGQYFRYDYGKDLAPQIQALKPRIASLIPLNEQYRMTWAYHGHSGLGNIGGNIWDIWLAIRDFDPRLVGLNYDTGHTTVRGGNGWGDAARVASKYIRCLAIKDVKWEHTSSGWRSEFCPIGEGLVDFRARFELLATFGFQGPVNIHYEHHGLLGTDLGTWKLDLPRAQFLAIVKQDLDRLRTAMRQAGVG